MRFSILVITAITFLTVGCVNDTSSEIEPPQNGEIIRDQALVSLIKSSPNAKTIAGVEYTVESFVWRNFAPSFNPPAGLLANNTLIREDGNTIESDFEIVQHYIVRDRDIWIPDDTETKLNQSSPNRLHVVSREGPEWEIDSKVNVGLKIKNQGTGDVFWLSVSSVRIVKTS
jgi:hypothetical protein